MKTVVRILLLIVLLGTAIFTVQKTPIRSYERPEKFFGTVDLPKLKVLEVIDLEVVNNGAPVIDLALYVPKGLQEEDLVSDILATFEWGNGKLKPYNCDVSIPAELRNCSDGIVVIGFLFEGTYIPVVGGGKAQPYMVTALVGLDQKHIPILLSKNITTLTGLTDYLDQVISEQPPGQRPQAVDMAMDPRIFLGFNNIK